MINGRGPIREMGFLGAIEAFLYHKNGAHHEPVHELMGRLCSVTVKGKRLGRTSILAGWSEHSLLNLRLLC